VSLGLPAVTAPIVPAVVTTVVAATVTSVVATVVTSIVTSIVTAIVATVVTAIVATVVTTIVAAAVATARRCLRRSRWGSGGWGRVLLTAPRSLRPGETALARRLRRVLVPGSAAALLGVPVPIIRRTVTRTRRSRRRLRSSMVKTAAELREPELIALAASTSFNGRLCGCEASKCCGEGNDASKRFHFAADRAGAKI